MVLTWRFAGKTTVLDLNGPAHRVDPATEEHWAIADLVGKAGQVRTVPIPTW